MAHCIPVSVSPSSRWMFGAAIETIVWSMNVIATAKIMPPGSGSSAGRWRS